METYSYIRLFLGAQDRIDFGRSKDYTDANLRLIEEMNVKTTENEQNQQKGRSNISYSIMSLVFPGMGQIVRGRVLAGLLFLLNVILYLAPLALAPQNTEYDIKTPALLIAIIVWAGSALDAFLYRSSFLIMALLVSLLSFGAGFFGSFLILPSLDI
jgi:hypothetical protein